MNITEANAVNVLVRALFPQVTTDHKYAPTPGAIYEAAHFLLFRSQQTLGAGLGPRDLPVPEVDA